MFQIGDTILYTTYGICNVSDIIQKEFNGQLTDYYVLTPLTGAKASLQVQVNNPITNEKLRNLLTKNEIQELIKNVPLIGTYWIENENERKKEFAAILRSGRRVDIIKVIRSIYKHGCSLRDKGRKLHACDEQVLKDAEKLIYEEFHYVLNMSYPEVIGILSKEFEATRA